MSIESEHGFRASMARQVGAGMLVLFLLVGGVGGWALATDIAGAVLASGNLVVESDVKKVQHPTGGVVAEIRVRDGDVVKAGDLLVRLDETVTRANLAIVKKTLNEQMARKARLEAERDGGPTITYPAELVAQKDDPETEHVMATEAKEFELRRSYGQKGLLRERIAQLKQEISGNEAQERAKAKELTLMQRELEGARKLWSQDLMPITKLTALEREATRLEGERAQLLAAIAEVKGKVAEVELQILQVDRQAGSDIAASCASVKQRSANSSSAGLLLRIRCRGSRSALPRRARCISPSFTRSVV